jgi:hypothetical protein
LKANSMNPSTLTKVRSTPRYTSPWTATSEVKASQSSARRTAKRDGSCGFGGSGARVGTATVACDGAARTGDGWRGGGTLGEGAVRGAGDGVGIRTGGGGRGAGAGVVGEADTGGSGGDAGITSGVLGMGEATGRWSSDGCVLGRCSSRWRTSATWVGPSMMFSATARFKKVRISTERVERMDSSACSVNGGEVCTVGGGP